MELSRLHNENGYLGENLPDDIPPLSIGTLSEGLQNVEHFRFLQCIAEQKTAVVTKIKLFMLSFNAFF